MRANTLKVLCRVYKISDRSNSTNPKCARCGADDTLTHRFFLCPPASRFGEMLAPSSIHPENTTLPSMKAPDFYKGAIFHVALWAIHSSFIHHFEEEATPTQINQVLVTQKLSWMVTQTFFGSSRKKICKAIALEWAFISGLVAIDTEFSVTIVPPELDCEQPFPLSPVSPSPLTLTLPSQKSLSPASQVSLPPSP
ncbi:hypothetical protein DSO57_1007295 [Entomophthora muscae]|uniref:Uncharacterized protein n=1 Tax=Entomophthora muscae TaxID=34485 RepID=A0ACC2RM64_9FUNG|nr:hypothetical protein DSO57_1007295 [Entomophthora muscae]